MTFSAPNRSVKQHGLDIEGAGILGFLSSSPLPVQICMNQIIADSEIAGGFDVDVLYKAQKRVLNSSVLIFMDPAEGFVFQPGGSCFIFNYVPDMQGISTIEDKVALLQSTVAQSYHPNMILPRPTCTYINIPYDQNEKALHIMEVKKELIVEAVERFDRIRKNLDMYNPATALDHKKDENAVKIGKLAAKDAAALDFLASLTRTLSIKVKLATEGIAKSVERHGEHTLSRNAVSLSFCDINKKFLAQIKEHKSPNWMNDCEIQEEVAKQLVKVELQNIYQLANDPLTFLTKLVRYGEKNIDQIEKIHSNSPRVLTHKSQMEEPVAGIIFLSEIAYDHLLGKKGIVFRAIFRDNKKIHVKKIGDVQRDHDNKKVIYEINPHENELLRLLPDNLDMLDELISGNCLRKSLENSMVKLSSLGEDILTGRGNANNMDYDRSLVLGEYEQAGEPCICFNVGEKVYVVEKLKESDCVDTENEDGCTPCNQKVSHSLFHVRFGTGEIEPLNPTNLGKLCQLWCRTMFEDGKSVLGKVAGADEDTELFCLKPMITYTPAISTQSLEFSEFEMLIAFSDPLLYSIDDAMEADNENAHRLPRDSAIYSFYKDRENFLSKYNDNYTKWASSATCTVAFRELDRKLKKMDGEIFFTPKANPIADDPYTAAKREHFLCIPMYTHTERAVLLKGLDLIDRGMTVSKAKALNDMFKTLCLEKTPKLDAIVTPDNKILMSDNSIVANIDAMKNVATQLLDALNLLLGFSDRELKNICLIHDVTTMIKFVLLPVIYKGQIILDEPDKPSIQCAVDEKLPQKNKFEIFKHCTKIDPSDTNRLIASHNTFHIAYEMKNCEPLIKIACLVMGYIKTTPRAITALITNRVNPGFIVMHHTAQTLINVTAKFSKPESIKLITTPIKTFKREDTNETREYGGKIGMYTARNTYGPSAIYATNIMPVPKTHIQTKQAIEGRPQMSRDFAVRTKYGGVHNAIRRCPNISTEDREQLKENLAPLMESRNPVPEKMEGSNVEAREEFVSIIQPMYETVSPEQNIQARPVMGISRGFACPLTNPTLSSFPDFVEDRDSRSESTNHLASAPVGHYIRRYMPDQIHVYGECEGDHTHYNTLQRKAQDAPSAATLILEELYSMKPGIPMLRQNDKEFLRTQLLSMGDTMSAQSMANVPSNKTPNSNTDRMLATYALKNGMSVPLTHYTPGMQGGKLAKLYPPNECYIRSPYSSKTLD